MTLHWIDLFLQEAIPWCIEMSSVKKNPFKMQTHSVPKNRLFYPIFVIIRAWCHYRWRKSVERNIWTTALNHQHKWFQVKSCSDLCYRVISVNWKLSVYILLVGEPMMSLPVVWNLSGIEKPQAPGRSDVKSVEGRPIVQDPLGSSIMDAAVVHQQLMTDAQTEALHPQYLGFGEQMP